MSRKSKALRFGFVLLILVNSVLLSFATLALAILFGGFFHNPDFPLGSIILATLISLALSVAFKAFCFTAFSRTAG